MALQKSNIISDIHQISRKQFNTNNFKTDIDILNTMVTFAWSMRTDNSFGANPPNIKLCIAPILAHASIVYIACGIIGIYMTTLSPFLTPYFIKTPASLDT